jgi:hypothetical protein
VYILPNAQVCFTVWPLVHRLQLVGVSFYNKPKLGSMHDSNDAPTAQRITVVSHPQNTTALQAKFLFNSNKSFIFMFVQ